MERCRTLERLSALSVALLIAGVCRAAITVRPVEPPPGAAHGAVLVETAFYRIRFDLGKTGSADSILYKPLDHELRAENYYSTPNTLFRGVVRLAEPDPITGRTRRMGGTEVRAQALQPATYRVVKQEKDRVVIEFEWKNVPGRGPAWMAKLVNRRRVFLEDGSPAIRIEREVVNTDAQPHPVILDFFNSASLGKVRTRVSVPGAEGKETGIDRALERSSSFLMVPNVAGAWIGGVNAKGLGVAFHYEWPDVDAMQVCMWKTIGATYHVVTRRRDVPAGGSVTFRYTFMPFSGLVALDGMKDDLVGGFTVGAKANYERDVAEEECQPGARVPLRVHLASGSDRKVTLTLRCVRQEDEKVVLDETHPLDLKTGLTAAVETQIAFPREGLYVATVTADDGRGTVLRMEKSVEVGRSRLTYAPTPPAGEKRGKRDGGESMSPPRFDPQFRTLDKTFVTRHEPFLKKHARGPVKAFFLTRADSTLAHVREIAERGDFDYEVAVCEKVQNPKGALHPQAFREFQKRFKAAEPDVFIALALDSEKGLKRRFLSALFRRVEEGMGAVITGPALKKQPLLLKMLAECTPVADTPMPVLALPPRPAKRYTRGKGRIVVIEQNMTYYRDDGFLLLRPWDQVAAAGRTVAVPEYKWRGFEYAYAYLGQLVRWAAGKESPVTVLGASLEGDAAVVRIANAGGPLRVTVEAAARTRRWEVRLRGRSAVDLVTGENTVRVALPGPLDGACAALEVSVRDGEGRLLAFGSSGVQPTPPVRAKLLLAPAYRPARAPGACAVTLEGRADQARVRLRVTDRFGRLVFDRTQPVALGAGPANVAFDLSALRPVCVYHEVVAQVFVGERLVDEVAADLYLMPPEPPYRSRFVGCVAGAPERKALHIQGMLAACRRARLEMHTHCYGGDAPLYASGGFTGAYAFFSPRRKHRDKVFDPPAYPPEDWLARMKKRWQARARQAYARGVRYIQIDDERRLSGEYDWSPRTLAAFRKHLKQVYPDIAALNRTWGTAFKSFGEVVPKTRKELGWPADNTAPWLEFRMFVGDLLAQTHMQRPAEWAAEISPEISVGELGIYAPSPDWPVDWSRYAKYYRDTGHYAHSGEVIGDLFRSFAPGTNHGTWQGYGMRAIKPGRRVQLWRSLLNGGHWAWFWAMRDNGFWNYAVCTNDLRVTRGYQALAEEEFPDIQGGIDRLLIASTYSDDRIAIGYSYPSWLLDRAALGVTSKRIVEELGYAFTFVDLKDVAKGRLERDGYRLLILQQTSCISKTQAAALRRFVEGGGTLLCVGRVGWRDLHGAPHRDGPVLDDLLGVDTRAVALADREATLAGSAGRFKLHLLLTGAKATQATVAAMATVEGLPPQPALTTRTTGKGRVVWLNSSLAGHQRFYSGGAAGERTATVTGPAAIRNSHHALFERVVRSAGIAPRCRVSLDDQPVYSDKTWYYLTPSKRTLLVARYLMADLKKPLRVKFARKAHVYELRSHKYHGETDAIADTFRPGHVKVYGLFDYRVRGIEAQVDKQRVAPGDAVKLTCRIVTDGKPADLHAIRLKVTGPDGKPLPEHVQVLKAEGGRAEVALPLALDQPAGAYTVTVQDAVSGMTGRTEFTIRK